MRILLASDAWPPQVNGVVRTLTTTVRKLQEWGHTVAVLEPNEFPGMPCPFYPEIRLCWPLYRKIVERITRFAPERIHIATEGPLGFAVRMFCRRHRLRFTTSYHTKFPEYLAEYLRLPASWTYRYMRWFHNAGAAIMSATGSLDRELTARGFQSPIRRWSRGVDLELFHPRQHTWADYPRPVMLYVGRVATEKGIEEFLQASAKGTKVIVGDGPIRERLQREYPSAVFLGYRKGVALAECYANADLFVFPSRTDTFGLVMIEALASGVPVAAHPVMGPIDIITNPKIGALSENLSDAIKTALSSTDRDQCIAAGRAYTWDACTRQFLGNTVPVE